MGIENADQTATSGDTQNPSSNGSDAVEKTLPQSKVNEIVAKEKAAVARSYEEKLKAADALAAELAELRAEKEKAAEAKLSAADRAAAEAKRRDDAIAKERAELIAQRDRAEARRVAAIRGDLATRKASALAATFWTPEMAQDVAALVGSRIVIEDDGKGGDRVLFRMSDADGDVEPLDEGFKKWVDAGALARFVRRESGSGGRHGTGGVGGSTRPNLALPGDDLIEAAMRARLSK